MDKHGAGISSEMGASDAGDPTRLVEVMPGRLSFQVHGNAGDYTGKTTSEMEAFLSGSSGIPESHHFTSSLHFGKIWIQYVAEFRSLIERMLSREDLRDKHLVYCTGSFPPHVAMTAFSMCAYMVLTSQQSPEAAARNLVNALSTLGISTGVQEIASKIPVLTILRVIMKANKLDWLRAWSASAHDQGNSLCEENRNWSATCVIPKRLTLIEFHDSTSLSWQGRNGWVELRKFGCAMAQKEVSCIYRLDPPSPAANRALKRCNVHVFERGTDGASAPSPDAVRRFFNVVQNESGHIVIQCSPVRWRDFGQFGGVEGITLIALYMNRFHGFTSAETAAWIQICRQPRYPLEMIESDAMQHDFVAACNKAKYSTNHTPLLQGAYAGYNTDACAGPAIRLMHRRAEHIRARSKTFDAGNPNILPKGRSFDLGGGGVGSWRNHRKSLGEFDPTIQSLIDAFTPHEDPLARPNAHLFSQGGGGDASGGHSPMRGSPLPHSPLVSKSSSFDVARAGSASPSARGYVLSQHTARLPSSSRTSSSSSVYSQPNMGSFDFGTLFESAVTISEAAYPGTMRHAGASLRAMPMPEINVPIEEVDGKEDGKWSFDNEQKRRTAERSGSSFASGGESQWRTADSGNGPYHDGENRRSSQGRISREGSAVVGKPGISLVQEEEDFDFARLLSMSQQATSQKGSEEGSVHGSFRGNSFEGSFDNLEGFRKRPTLSKDGAEELPGAGQESPFGALPGVASFEFPPEVGSVNNLEGFRKAPQFELE